MGVGELLRSRRQQQGLALAEIESATKIRAKYIEALESEAFTELPGEVYLVGFLRIYARLLGLDPDAVVAEYRSAHKTPDGGRHPPPRPTHPPAGYPSGWRRLDGRPGGREPGHEDMGGQAREGGHAGECSHEGNRGGGEETGRGAEKAYSWPGLPQPEPEQLPVRPSGQCLVEPYAERDAAAPAPPAGAGSLQRIRQAATGGFHRFWRSLVNAAASGRKPVLGALAVVICLLAVAALAFSILKSSRGQPHNGQPPVQAQAPAPPPQQYAVVIVIHARELCWAEITVDGTTSFTGNIQPGDTKAFQGNESIRLHLGNAGGVEVYYNGVELPPLGGEWTPVTEEFTKTGAMTVQSIGKNTRGSEQSAPEPGA
jgi:transcriptional regulator with XRE-family HTH domain